MSPRVPGRGSTVSGPRAALIVGCVQYTYRDINQVTTRGHNGALAQVRQECVGLREGMTVVRPLLTLAGVPGSTAATPSRIHIEGHERQRFAARVAPLVHQAERLVDQEPGPRAAVLPSTVLAPVPERT